MIRFKNTLVGGGVMADKIKYGTRVVARVNHGVDEEELETWFSLISAAKDMYELLYEMAPEDCSGMGKFCIHCRARKVLKRVEGLK